MPYMTEGEIGFEILLMAKKVNYTPKQLIRFKYNKLKGKYFIPDFYLPDYNGFCEVISNKQSFDYRTLTIKQAIQEGHAFTFYDDRGRKIIFTKYYLSRIGLTNNKELFIIKEFDFGEITITGAKYANSRLYPEYTPKEKVHGKLLTLEQETEIFDMYKRGSTTQQYLANLYSVSQALISKIIISRRELTKTIGCNKL